MSTTPLPLLSPSDRAELAPAARGSLVAAVLAAHGVLAWGLLQVAEVRESVSQVVPLMVELIAPQPVPAPSPPTPKIVKAPPSPAPKIAKPPPPAPLITSAPTPQPAEPAFVAPPPPAEPTPPAIEAPPAPAAPSPEPRTIPATAVQYLDPPAPVYPTASRRNGETGQVLVRVEIDATGRAAQVHLLRSSGHRRLDESALAAVRAARFKPYTENGVPLAVWSTVPIVFELEN